MKNIILSIAAALVIMTGFTSCKLMSDLFGEETVVTTPSQLVQGAEMEPVPLDSLPASIVEELPSGTELVLASREDLIEEGAYVPLSPGEGDIPGILDAIVGLGSAFIPGFAAWEGILTLISRRKRRNYAKAIKALVPSDRNIDIAGTVHGVAAAIGVSHSTEASQLVVEEEDEEEMA
tara:strand:+ start:507 stop:1040 length:534 start_codon:yes stop_codon:yes gene_type:complete